MTHEKYLFWFRLCFPIDWVNDDKHEVIELVFIIAKSNKETLFWGNKIAEKLIEKLLIANNYHSEKINFRVLFGKIGKTPTIPGKRNWTVFRL